MHVLLFTCIHNAQVKLNCALSIRVNHIRDLINWRLCAASGNCTLEETSACNLNIETPRREMVFPINTLAISYNRAQFYSCPKFYAHYSDSQNRQFGQHTVHICLTTARYSNCITPQCRKAIMPAWVAAMSTIK